MTDMYGYQSKEEELKAERQRALEESYRALGPISSGPIPAEWWAQQQNTVPENDGVSDSNAIVRGLASGGAGVLQGQAQLANLFGVGDGQFANYLEDVVNRNARKKEYTIGDMLPFASDYYTNPEGMLYDMANLGGSSITLGAETAATLGLGGMVGGMVGLGGAAGTTGAIARGVATGANAVSKLSKAMGGVARKAGYSKLATALEGPMGQLYALNILRTPIEVSSEMGQAGDVALKNGETLDEAQKQALVVGAIQIPLLGLSNTIESAGLGGFFMKEASEAIGEKATKTTLMSVLGNITREGLQNAWEEGMQQSSQEYAADDQSLFGVVNPIQWSEEAAHQAAVGAVGGMGIGTGHAAGTWAYNALDDSPKASKSYEPNVDANEVQTVQSTTQPENTEALDSKQARSFLKNHLDTQVAGGEEYNNIQTVLDIGSDEDVVAEAKKYGFGQNAGVTPETSPEEQQQTATDAVNETVKIMNESGNANQPAVQSNVGHTVVEKPETNDNNENDDSFLNIRQTLNRLAETGGNKGVKLTPEQTEKIKRVAGGDDLEDLVTTATEFKIRVPKQVRNEAVRLNKAKRDALTGNEWYTAETQHMLKKLPAKDREKYVDQQTGGVGKYVMKTKSAMSVLNDPQYDNIGKHAIAGKPEARAMLEKLKPLQKLALLERASQSMLKEAPDKTSKINDGLPDTVGDYVLDKSAAEKDGLREYIHKADDNDQTSVNDVRIAAIRKVGKGFEAYKATAGGAKSWQRFKTLVQAEKYIAAPKSPNETIIKPTTKTSPKKQTASLQKSAEQSESSERNYEKQSEQQPLTKSRTRKNAEPKKTKQSSKKVKFQSNLGEYILDEAIPNVEGQAEYVHEDDEDKDVQRVASIRISDGKFLAFKGKSDQTPKWKAFDSLDEVERYIVEKKDKDFQKQKASDVPEGVFDDAVEDMGIDVNEFNEMFTSEEPSNTQKRKTPIEKSASEKDDFTLTLDEILSSEENQKYNLEKLMDSKLGGKEKNFFKKHPEAREKIIEIALKKPLVLEKSDTKRKSYFVVFDGSSGVHKLNGKGLGVSEYGASERNVLVDAIGCQEEDYETYINEHPQQAPALQKKTPNQKAQEDEYISAIPAEAFEDFLYETKRKKKDGKLSDIYSKELSEQCPLGHGSWEGWCRYAVYRDIQLQDAVEFDEITKLKEQVSENLLEAVADYYEYLYNEYEGEVKITAYGSSFDSEATVIIADEFNLSQDEATKVVEFIRGISPNVNIGDMSGKMLKSYYNEYVAQNNDKHNEVKGDTSAVLHAVPTGNTSLEDEIAALNNFDLGQAKLGKGSGEKVEFEGWNPSLLAQLIKIGNKAIADGYNTFSSWSTNLSLMFSALNDKIKTMAMKLLKCVWSYLENIPETASFAEDKVAETLENMKQALVLAGKTTELGMGFADFKKKFPNAFPDKWEKLKDYFKAAFIAIDKYPRRRFGDVVELNENNNGGEANESIRTPRTSSQSNSSRGDGNGVEGISGTADASSENQSQGNYTQTSREVEPVGQSGGRSNGSQNVSGSWTPAGGAQSNQQGGRQVSDSSGRSSRSSNHAGSSRTGQNGSSLRNTYGNSNTQNSFNEKQSNEIAEGLNNRIKNIPFKAANEANIAETLPTLFKEQQRDIVAIEKRFWDDDSKGMLVANGTGTGKTFVGMGAIIRSLQHGKKNILVVVPSSDIAKSWIADGRALGFDNFEQLTTNKPSDDSVVLTTYKSLTLNKYLLDIDWDFIVCDECHNLASGASSSDVQQKGFSVTDTVEALRANMGYNGPSGQDGLQGLMNIKYREEYSERAKLSDKVLELKFSMDELYAKGYTQKLKETEKECAIAIKDLQKVTAFLDNARKKESATYVKRYGRKGGVHGGKCKVLLLSASPFAYSQNAYYADDLLFSYTDDYDGNPNNFLQREFGFEYTDSGKLVPPSLSPGVLADNTPNEIKFHNKLVESGAMIKRRLELEQDYNRKFVKVKADIGEKIDLGFAHLKSAEYRELGKYMNQRFTHQAKARLLESMKAQAAVPLIKDYIAEGMKVVLFHDTKKQDELIHPFKLNRGEVLELSDELRNAYRNFCNEFPELIALDVEGQKVAIDVIKENFGGNVGFVNGSETEKKKNDAISSFNDDDSNINLIMVTVDAGKEGISLHDTTGKHPRVLINIGLPTKPTAVIQLEGRIYRIGQASNAMFRYLLTGTKMEKLAFYERIANRSKTAENLALGSDARALDIAIQGGYMVAADGASDSFDAKNDKENSGGKQADKRSRVETARDIIKGLNFDLEFKAKAKEIYERELAAEKARKKAHENEVNRAKILTEDNKLKFIETIKDVFHSNKVTVVKDGIYMVELANGRNLWIDTTTSQAAILGKMSHTEKMRMLSAHDIQNSDYVLQGYYQRTHADGNGPIVDIIRLTEAAQDGTLDHEAMHFVHNVLLTAEEKAHLLAYYKHLLKERIGEQNLKALSEKDLLDRCSEMEADDYAAFAAADRRPKNMREKIFWKIQKWLALLLDKVGVRTPIGIYAAVRSGKMFARKEQKKRNAIGKKEFQLAYHGTRGSNFDKLSTKHSGTHANYYGWGLYFGSKRNALSYADPDHGTAQVNITSKLGSYTGRYGDGYFNTRSGISVKASSPLEMALDAFAYITNMRENLDMAYRLIQDKSNWGVPQSAIDKAKTIIKENADAVKVKELSNDTSGRMFKVDIPEDDVLLDFDKPASQQPLRVKQALKTLGLYQAAESGESIYRTLADKLGSEKNASLHLLESGIPGHKVLDADEGPTYVVYDEELVKTISITPRPKKKKTYKGDYLEDVQDGYFDDEAEFAKKYYAELEAKSKEAKARGKYFEKYAPIVQELFEQILLESEIGANVSLAQRLRRDYPYATRYFDEEYGLAPEGWKPIIARLKQILQAVKDGTLKLRRKEDLYAVLGLDEHGFPPKSPIQLKVDNSATITTKHQREQGFRLVEMIKRTGIDVVTDKDEMQRVLGEPLDEAIAEQNVEKLIIKYPEGDRAPDLSIVMGNIRDENGKDVLQWKQRGKFEPQYTVAFAGEKPKKYKPKKVGKAYKLMEQWEDGSLHPLFAGAGKSYKLGEWHWAEGFIPDTQESTANDDMLQVKEMKLAPRYGWHMGTGLPATHHLMGVGDTLNPVMGYYSKAPHKSHKSKRVWVEVHYDATNDYTDLALKNPDKKEKDIRGLIPFGGYYMFQESNLSNWIIASGIQFHKVLSEDERQKILKDAGYNEELVWREQVVKSKLKAALTRVMKFLNGESAIPKSTSREKLVEKKERLEELMSQNQQRIKELNNGKDWSYKKRTLEELAAERERIRKEVFDNPELYETTEFLRTAGGEVYGFVKDGKIYLDPDLLDSNVPIHEYTHIWDKVLQAQKPAFWKAGKTLLKKTKLWESIAKDPLYANIAHDEDLLASEVHARLVGKQGEEFLEKQELPKNATDKIKKWIRTAWEHIKGFFGKTVRKDLSKLTVDEFVSMPLSDLSKGVKIDSALLNNSTKVQKQVTGTYHNPLNTMEFMIKPIDEVNGKKLPDDIRAVNTEAAKRADEAAEKAGVIETVYKGLSKEEKLASGSLYEATFKSPSRLAEKNPVFKSFYTIYTKAQEVQEKLRARWRNQFQTFVGSMNEKEFNEYIELMQSGELAQKEYTIEELQKDGYSKTVISAYTRTRQLLRNVWTKVNDAHRGLDHIKVQSMKGSELKKLLDEPFVENVSVRPSKENKGIPFKAAKKEDVIDIIEYDVTYDKPKVYTSSIKQRLTKEQLNELKGNPYTIVKDVEEKHIGEGTNVITFYEAHVERVAPPIGKITGYLPHIYEQWMVLVETEEGWQPMGSGKTLKEAVDIADKLAANDKKNGKQLNYKVAPKLFDPSKYLGGEEKSGKGKPSLVVSDSEYIQLQKALVENSKMSIPEARNALKGAVSRANRNRFFGNIRHRKGRQGYNKDIVDSIDRYLTMSSRYCALQPAKQKAISLFERTYGRWDKEYGGKDAMASIVKRYIRYNNGTPNYLESMLTTQLSKFDWWNKHVSANYGDRLLVSLAGTVNGVLSTSLLGCLNISSAVVGLTQLMNTFALIGHKYTSRGMAAAHKMSLKDKRILAEAGIPYNIGLDTPSGFSKRRTSIKGKTAGYERLKEAVTIAGNKGMWLFSKADATTRAVSTLGAYYEAIEKKGMTHKQSIAYAKDINRKANFDYGSSDAPGVYQMVSGTFFGDIALLFQKYPMKELELMASLVPYLGRSNKYQKARFWGAYMLMTGFAGIPGGDWLDEFLETILGYKPSTMMKAELFKSFGDNFVTRTFVYGIGANLGIDISRRIGMSGVFPDHDSLLGYMTGPAGSILPNTIKAIGNDDYIKAIKSVNPTLGNIAEALRGYSKNSKGQVSYKYEGTERFIKAMGFRPVSQSLNVDMTSALYYEKRRSIDDRQRVLLSAAQKQANVESLSREEIAELKKHNITPKQLKEAVTKLRMTTSERMAKTLTKKQRTEQADNPLLDRQ